MPGPIAHKSYGDFVIRIVRSAEGSYVAEAQGPTGEASNAFVLPYDEKDLEIFLLRVGRPRQSGRGRIPQDMKQTAEFGQQLYHAVIHDEVRDLFVSARRQAELSGSGLRLRLRLSEAPELNDLPWEFLYDGREFLALSDDTPLIRYIDLPNPPRPLGVALPMRILVTVSAPHDQAPINNELETTNIQGALSRLVADRRVEVEFSNNAMLKTLQRTLRRAQSQGRPFHVWHYIGHGAYDSQQETSVLLLCDQNNLSHPVGGFELGTLFDNYPDTRLALLNACEGARTDQEDPFAGVAAALVERGVPAVIGMQFEISDAAAITFSSEFYNALVDGLPLDTACTNARRAVFFLPNYTEWATPVLYMRAPEGKIFEVSPASLEYQKTYAELPPDAGLENRLADLYDQGLEAFYSNEWGQAVERFRAIVDLRPNYEQAASFLKRSTRRARLHGLHRQALAGIESEDWQAAQEALQALIAEDPEFEGAAALLERVDRQKRLHDLYQDARRLTETGKWQAVLNIFSRIDELQDDFPDPDQLRAGAQLKLAAIQLEEKVKDLYRQGLREMEAGRWLEARQLLLQVQDLAPEHERVGPLLARIEGELETQKQAEAELERLYTEGLSAVYLKNWQAAQRSLQTLVDRKHDYRDAAEKLAEVEQIARVDERYQRALADIEQQAWAPAIEQLEAILVEAPQFPGAEEKLAAARKAQELSDLYQQARQYSDAEDWHTVLEIFERINELNPEYPDPEGLRDQATARIRLLDPAIALTPPGPGVEPGLHPSAVEGERKPEARPGIQGDSWRNGLLVIAPGVILLILLKILPVLGVVWQSLVDARGLSTSGEFIGLENYSRVFGMSSFGAMLRNTAGLAVIRLLVVYAVWRLLASAWRRGWMVAHWQVLVAVAPLPLLFSVGNPVAWRFLGQGTSPLGELLTWGSVGDSWLSLIFMDMVNTLSVVVAVGLFVYALAQDGPKDESRPLPVILTRMRNVGLLVAAASALQSFTPGFLLAPKILAVQIYALMFQMILIGRAAALATLLLIVLFIPAWLVWKRVLLQPFRMVQRSRAEASLATPARPQWGFGLLAAIPGAVILLPYVWLLWFNSTTGGPPAEFNLGQLFVNSLLLPGLAIGILQLPVAFLCAYGLTLLPLPGKGTRKALLLLFVLGAVVGEVIVMVPLFSAMIKLGWINTSWVGILPLVSSSAVVLILAFLLKSFEPQIRQARAQGLGELAIFRQRVLPAFSPVLLLIGTVSIYLASQRLLWPLVMGLSIEKGTFTLALAMYRVLIYGGAASIPVLGFPIALLFSALLILAVHLVLRRMTLVIEEGDG